MKKKKPEPITVPEETAPKESSYLVPPGHKIPDPENLVKEIQEEVKKRKGKGS